MFRACSPSTDLSAGNRSWPGWGTKLLFVNDDYGLISERQEAHCGESFGTKLTNRDFMTLAKSFGIDGYRPTEWDELEEMLRDALSSTGLSLVEVPLE